MQIGAQMYTVRMFGQNERDLGRTLEKLAKIGYRCVQLSALGPIEPRHIKALCDQNGLSIVLTHNPEGDFLDRTDALIERHLLYGCRYVGLGYLPDRYHCADFLPYFTDDFGPAAERLRPRPRRRSGVRTGLIRSSAYSRTGRAGVPAGGPAEGPSPGGIPGGRRPAVPRNERPDRRSCE